MTSNTWEYDIHELNKMMIYMAHILVLISALYSAVCTILVTFLHFKEFIKCFFIVHLCLVYKLK
jgi:hypothetical protein